MDFEKPSISKNVSKFLEENLKTEKEKESLNNVIAGKTVLKNDVIILLRTILHALTTKDALVDEEFSAAILSVEDDEGEKDELPNSGICLIFSFFTSSSAMHLLQALGTAIVYAHF